jgi:CheY-like chemotaxis protein
LQGSRVAPDVVVTDYKMPRMDGAELSRRLEADHPSLPVLIITGYTGTTDDVLHLPRLAKPFGRAEIGGALNALVGPDDKVVRCRAAKGRRASAFLWIERASPL